MDSSTASPDHGVERAGAVEPVVPVVSIGPVGPVVLVGMMATGKTTVGTRVAEALGRAVLDSDAMIERRTGRTVAQLWAERGVAAYRSLETEVLEEAMAVRPPGVVAAAGGVVLSVANRARLRRASADGALVVWLQADPAALAARVVPGDHRPLLAEDPAGTLRRLATEREPLYAEVADHAVDAGRLGIEEVVAEVLALVGTTARAAAGPAATAAPKATAARKAAARGAGMAGDPSQGPG